MKRCLFILAFALVTSGCNGLNRLLGQSEEPTNTYVESIGGSGPLGDAPNFNVPTPDGTERVVYHGRLPSTNLIQMTGDTVALRVFIFEGGQVNHWFQIAGHEVQGGYYFQFDQQSNQVQFYGTWINNKEYCIYQYVPTL